VGRDGTKERATLEKEGVLYIPAIRRAYAHHSALIQDGANHQVLTGHIPINCPIRLLHGQADPDVPWELALRIAEQAESADTRVILIKDGDHRLSRPRTSRYFVRPSPRSSARMARNPSR